MPWLVILGSGSWSYGRTRYEAGLHEVDEEVAEAARRAPKKLLVTAERPVLARSEGPLTMDDVRLGGLGVELARPEIEVTADGTRPLEVIHDFKCDWCPRTFPSRGARERHVEFKHAVEPPAEG